MIDEFYGFKLGVLEYRTVRFETEELDCENYQGNAVVNYRIGRYRTPESLNTSILSSASSQQQ